LSNIVTYDYGVIGPSGRCSPRDWNNLPGAIQATKTLSAFKKRLKLHQVTFHIKIH